MLVVMPGLREKPGVGVSGVDSSLDSHHPIVAGTPEKTRNMGLGVDSSLECRLHYMLDK